MRPTSLSALVRAMRDRRDAPLKLPSHAARQHPCSNALQDQFTHFPIAPVFELTLRTPEYGNALKSSSGSLRSSREMFLFKFVTATA